MTPEQLDRLEQKLWQLIDTYSEAEVDHFPPVESLLGPEDACDFYAEALNLYATAIIEKRESAWDKHPLLEHLNICERCLKTLNRNLAGQGGKRLLRWRRGPDADITIFEEHFSGDEEDLRGAVDVRRPRLLSSDFMRHPPDWHYSLESMAKPGNLRPSIRLTLAAPDDNSDNIPITLALFGQILQGVTNEAGEVEFHPDLIPLTNDLKVPVLNVHVHLSELEVA